MHKLTGTLGIALAVLSTQALATGAISPGWTTVGNSGSSSAQDGVVNIPSGYSSINWISTNGGVDGNTLPGYPGTNGSTATSPTFSAAAGDQLSFMFDYVTSDGSGYPDYGWAGLYNSADNSLAAMLFTAVTTPSGNTVPGNGMPPIDAVTNPSFVSVVAGAPDWSPLGGSTGSCWDVGCGYTGWVSTSYTIGAAGSYYLQFGVANARDTLWDSGMAFAGAAIAGSPIDDTHSPVPEPEQWLMLLFGMPLLAARLRKFR